jgi:hypothetical protein
VRSRKKQELEIVLSNHRTPDEATSLFRDLPVYKSRSGYQMNGFGSLVHSPSTQGSKGSADSFDFPLARIDSEDLQTMNALAFNEAYDLSKLIFTIESASKRSLEFFLRMRSTDAYSLKNYSSEMDPRVLHLKRLEKASELLGTRVERVYKLAAREIMSEEEYVERFGPEFLRKKPSCEPYQSFNAPLNDPFEVKDVLHLSAPANLIERSSKDSRDDSTVLEQIIARIGQLEAALPRDQPETVEDFEESTNFFEAIRMMTQNSELTPVRRAIRVAMRPSAELDRFFASADKNRSK